MPMRTHASARSLCCLLFLFIAAFLLSGATPAFALPDLQDGGSAYRWFTPTNIYPGQTITVQGRVTNSGTMGAVAGWPGFRTGIYLSTDTTITKADRYLGGTWINYLAAKTASNFTISVTVPENVAPGTYYVGWYIDDLFYIDESNENNNTAYVINRRLIVFNDPPNKPGLVSPANGATNLSLTPTLSASAYYDFNGDPHNASQWMVADNSAFNSPVFNKVDAVNKTSITLPSGFLTANKTYYWSVRYQDSRSDWSAWANSRSFKTAASGGGGGGGGGGSTQLFDSIQPVAGLTASRWAFMTAWNLSTDATHISASWRNGVLTWEHNAWEYNHWIARFVYDQASMQTRALLWYYRQVHVQ